MPLISEDDVPDLADNDGHESVAKAQHKMEASLPVQGLEVATVVASPALLDVEEVRLATMEYDPSAATLFDDEVVLTPEQMDSPLLDRLSAAGRMVHSLTPCAMTRLKARHQAARQWQEPITDLTPDTMGMLVQRMTALHASLLEIYTTTEETLVSMTWGGDRREIGRIEGRVEVATRVMGLAVAGEHSDIGVKAHQFSLAVPLPMLSRPRGVTDEQWRALVALARQPYGVVLVAAQPGERNRAMQILTVLRQSLAVQERPVVMEWGTQAHSQKVLEEGSRRVVIAMVSAPDPEVWMATPGMVEPGWRDLLNALLIARVSVTARGRVCPFCGEINRVADYAEVVEGEGCDECAGTGFIGGITLLDLDLVKDGRALLRVAQAASDARKAGWIVS